MKKNVVIFVIILLFYLPSNQLFAQKLYFKISSGYSLKYQAEPLDWSYNFIDDNGYNYQRSLINFKKNTYNNSKLSSTEMIKVSMGQGINFQGGAGYKINKVIALELNCKYLHSYKYILNNYFSEVNFFNQTLSGYMLFISPSIKFMYELKKITPFLSVGYNIGVGSFTHTIHEVTSYTSIRDIEFQRKFYGGYAEGITTCLGTDVKVSNHISFFCEITATNIKYAPTNATIVKYVDNGINILNSTPLSEKEIKFVDEITYNTSQIIVLGDEPSESYKVIMPFSSLGLNIGFLYKF